jgi:hypothetical protein
MKETIVKTAFSYQAFTNSQKMIWRYAAKSFIGAYVFYMAFSILCLTIGVRYNDPISAGVAGGFLFYVVLSWLAFFNKRTLFFKRLKRYTAFEGGDCTYSFLDEAFEYQDPEKLLRLNWSAFRSFVEYQDHIMVFLKDGASPNFAFGKTEMGDEAYAQIVAFLEGKMGRGKRRINGAC